MRFLRAIRWALMAEIVVTQVAIAVIMELFRREQNKTVTRKLTKAYGRKYGS